MKAKAKNNKPRFRISNLYGIEDFAKIYIGRYDYYIHRIFDIKELVYVVNRNQIRACSKGTYEKGEITLIP